MHRAREAEVEEAMDELEIPTATSESCVFYSERPFVEAEETGIGFAIRKFRVGELSLEQLARLGREMLNS